MIDKVRQDYVMDWIAMAIQLITSFVFARSFRSHDGELKPWPDLIRNLYVQPWYDICVKDISLSL